MELFLRKIFFFRQVIYIYIYIYIYMSPLGLEPVTSPKPTPTLYRLSSMPQELVLEEDEMTSGIDGGEMFGFEAVDTTNF